MRIRPNLLPALIAIALGAAVTAAANGRSWSSAGGHGGASSRTLALLLVAGIGVVAFLVTRIVWSHRSSGLTWPLAVATFGPVILVTLALTIVALLWHRTSDCARCNLGSPNGSTYGGSAPAGQTPNGGVLLGRRNPAALKSVHHHAHSTSLPFLLLALALLIVAAVIWIRHQHRQGGLQRIRRPRARRIPQDAFDPESTTAPDQAEIATAYIESSLDDIRRAPDLRRAVIACYARMEQLFAHIGCAREDWETPFEFLHRTSHHERQPLDALTRLYEQAQYSPHPLEERQRFEAIAALTALRDQLRATAIRS